jgi:L,D-transpeptidase ErfK/SrfK
MDMEFLLLTVHSAATSRQAGLCRPRTSFAARVVQVTLLLTIPILASLPLAAQKPSAAPGMTGGLFSYVVQKGDSLTLVGARFGITVATLAALNGLRSNAFLRQGQTLQIDNRHLMPRMLENGIVVNIPQRMLFFFESGRLVGDYPVAVGRPDWQTPTGTFRVLEKQHQKVWHVPKSIQEEMRRERQVVRQEVPPGPENPLGEYWMRFSPSCGIHGTNFPASVYSVSTHGCLRLQPEAIADIYPMVWEGMPVEIIYQPVLYGKIDDTCYLEVNRDVYGRRPPALEPIEAWAAASGLIGAIQWSLVVDELRSSRGIARAICR